MTCIVGLVEDGRVYIGGDSAGSNGYSVTVRKDPKVFRNGPALFGFTSSFRMGQILRYDLALPKRHADEDLMAYMVTAFVPAVRTALKSGGYARTENGEESGGTFLVGIEGRLFNIAGDFQVGESCHSFDAVGCGEDFALGSLWSTGGQSPHARVTAALCAAEEFSTGVRGPFTIEVLS